MATINSDLYNEGIDSTLINTGDKKLFIALVDTSDKVLAVSALMTSEALNNYLTTTDYFTWNGTSSQISISQIAYDKTVDLARVMNDFSDDQPAGFEPINANYFVICRFGTGHTFTEEKEGSPYTGSECIWKFPAYTAGGDGKLTSNDIIVKGGLNNEPTINYNSNYMLSATTITFNTTDAN